MDIEHILIILVTLGLFGLAITNTYIALNADSISTYTPIWHVTMAFGIIAIFSWAMAGFGISVCIGEIFGKSI